MQHACMWQVQSAAVDADDGVVWSGLHKPQPLPDRIVHVLPFTLSITMSCTVPL